MDIYAFNAHTYMYTINHYASNVIHIVCVYINVSKFIQTNDTRIITILDFLFRIEVLRIIERTGPRGGRGYGQERHLLPVSRLLAALCLHHRLSMGRKRRKRRRRRRKEGEGGGGGDGGKRLYADNGLEALASAEWAPEAFGFSKALGVELVVFDPLCLAQPTTLNRAQHPLHLWLRFKVQGVEASSGHQRHGPR